MEEKGKSMGPQIIGLLIYVCLSAAGLTLIKIGLNKQGTLLLDKNGFTLAFSWLLVLGMVLYILSFLTSLIVMKSMNLSVYYPLSAGLIYVAICVLSFVVLKEKIGVSQLIGMSIILVGIIVMNLGKGN
ncbi:MAG: hypothetical protein MJ108_08510 [Saccharofermentans sp.]|nr:hypothetical protein [Saccharofermentans sp.]